MGLYGAIAFIFSFIGFVALPPVIHFHEYSFPEAILEVGGHFAFGAIAALPFRDFETSFLCGSFAVAIDVDHVLASLNLSFSSRPDHSVAFVLVSMVLMRIYERRRSSPLTGPEHVSMVWLVPVSVSSHISYDILAAYNIFPGRGFSFPLFVPFSYALVPFPFWAWVPLEASALVLALWAWRRHAKSV